MNTPESSSFYTLPFIMVCLSNFLFAASFTMILPELPAYLTSLGGEDYKGYIIALFTLMALIARPFSGKLSDTVGRIPVMLVGSIACVLCSLMYPVLTTVGGFLFLRFLHGFSTGFHPTAASAYGADIIPAHRRGEAMGILGISSNIGMTSGMAIGSIIAAAFTTTVMFQVSSGIAVVTILLLFSMKETLPNKQAFSWKLLKIKPSEIIEFQAIAPGIVTFSAYFFYGSLLTIMPDQTDSMGMLPEERGMVFSIFTVCSIASRAVAGRVSDRLGRVFVLRFALIPLAISIAALGFVNTPLQLYITGGLTGFFVGIVGPTVFAWAIDRSADERRGRALATVYIAVEAAIGIAALLSAFVFANQVENLPLTWGIMGAMPILGLIYLLFGTYKREQKLT